MCDKKKDEELAAFLRIDSCMMSMIKSEQFVAAIACLKQVKEKYCPREMLANIENTFKLLDMAKNESFGTSERICLGTIYNNCTFFFK